MTGEKVVTDQPAWTVERVLRTPVADILAAVKRGEGPPADVMAQIIHAGLSGRLRRLG